MKLNGIVPRCATTAATIVTAMTGTLAFAAPPASATQSTTPGPPSGCRVFASEPRLSSDGHEITGFGTSHCLGTGWEPQKLVVSLQFKPLPWIYVPVAETSTVYTSSPSLRATVSAPCTPGVTAWYTIETSWYGRNGELYAYAYPGASVEVTCPS